MHILYVEDNPANISLLQRIARMGGHNVTSYNDGEVALAHFEQDKPDLILMDLQLAGALGGLDVVRTLRADGVTTPIIAVTAYAMVGDKERCMEAGCDGYLAKPLPVAELVETVQKYEQALKSKDVPPVEAPPEPAKNPESDPVASRQDDTQSRSDVDPSRVLREVTPLPDLASKAAARKAAARERKESPAKATITHGTAVRPEPPVETSKNEALPVKRVTGTLGSVQESAPVAGATPAPVAASEGKVDTAKQD